LRSLSLAGRRLVLAFFVFALTTLAGMPVALAADNGPVGNPPPGSGQFLESWALSPTGSDPTQPGTRTALTYNVAPGAVQQDSVSLWNYSDVPLTFHVYATDAFNNGTGDFTLLPSDHKPTDVGSWVQLKTGIVDVAPKERVDLPFTVTVPKDATPGDHTAGIVASVPTDTIDPNGNRVTVDRRTGSRLYLRVQGPVNPSITVENLSSDYKGTFNPLDGTLEVTYTLNNPGNVRLGAHQVITVHDLVGREVASRKLRDLPELLPKNHFTVHQKFTGIPATLRVGTDVKITPFAAQAGVSGTELPSSTTSTTNSWAIPWTVILLLLLAVLLWRLRRRWQRSHPRAAPPTSGTERARPTPPAPGAPTNQPRIPDPVARSYGGRGNPAAAS